MYFKSSKCFCFSAGSQVDTEPSDVSSLARLKRISIATLINYAHSLALALGLYFPPI